MKWLVIVLVLISTQAMAMQPEGLYGCTEDGFFYIHEELVTMSGGNEPYLVAGITQYQRIPMLRIRNYWVIKLPVYLTKVQWFCFQVEHNKYIPDCILEEFEEWEYMENSVGGYNFVSIPQRR